ncbi:MAG: hypothetical protein ABL903_01990 [Methylococcales bacterium]
MAKGGVQPGSGRPKGKQNAVTLEIKEMIRAALDVNGGVEYLAAQARDNPVAFMSLLAKIIPKEIAADVNMTGQIIVQVSPTDVDL